MRKKLFNSVKVQPKNIQNAIFPIMILNWLTGFSIIEYPKNNPRPILSFIYVSLCIFAYISAYFVDFHDKYHDNNEIRKDIFLYLKHCNSVISFCCIVIGWYNYKAWKIILQRIMILDEHFDRLLINHKYREIFINLLCKITFWLILICTLIYLSFYSLLQILDLPKVTQLVLTLHYPIHVNAVVDFTFTAIISCLGLRFIDINSLLKKLITKNKKTQNEKYWQSTCGRKIYFISTDSNLPFKNHEEKKLIKFLILKSLYKELTDISVEVNRIYQIQIVILIASFFTVLTGFYYNSFAGIFFKNIDVHEHWSSKVCGLLWCIAYSYRFYEITITCSRVSSEAMKTKEILFEIRNATDDEELKCEIDQFTLQITQCPLVFNACGLFTVDYSLFENFIGRVMMYTVILIQFSPDVQNLL